MGWKSGAARIPAAFAVALSAVLALALLLQTPTDAADARSVRGTVSDRSGKPIAGAIVKLKDSRTLRIRSFITRQDGVYHFYGLSSNADYEVVAEHNGASSGTKTVSQFNTDKVITVDLKIG
jgi:Carboxypeptidase regulatory-like domain